ncbi:acetyl-CoA carboxylase carboxyltransferase subunit alpha [Clostridium luticellarii]|jgi:acetyl-CoA carboxylase carboxyl transferase subunit alpha|uniref:Acetyl-coenzyme A carboxylase carboxyl transferase subunit alpha n=1 Tax=Clostridium luticellarii TaxID=1691940 RepID=A0A2T0BP40_9CLOT|nr:acetyl-CoA carboxylase carboxyltransferase subunit alpha [Clostridium luticellarii]MCI1944636.1 acetyl-CoA carboxylase carboxyltransferase subunit alpha [Clostridium luticellarii]MCI1968135.1 acetyl-CoA carboxylase carboxyltransferase subunit alpha [Clostridium luticellarii]MCI1994752.1 acetyl-CoA carboxylase carboxyltransferase subunit alpha [Clostridium luticellarii]MCI2038984.1 acetyl-CoA carboxylase carboxyltransferase subunit alpha [Clostridium luticellarii]PRR85640.1 Acetyl-coenzyme A
MEKLERVQKILNKRLDVKGAWKRVTLARMMERPTSLDYIGNIFDSFMELHGDRCFGDDPSVVGGIALLDGEAVTVVAQQKGRNTKENIKRNFGMPNPEGYRKGLRLMKQADKFDRPIICFVDTPGAFCGMEAEERGQGEAIARNLMEVFALKVPIISIIIGEGGSGGALAFAVADSVWMLENSIYSVLSPEGFAGILWKDASRAKEAAAVMKITAQDLKKYGIIDKVLKEPVGGAQKDVSKMSKIIKEKLIEQIGILKKRSFQELQEERYSKFRHIGKFID